MTTKAQFRRILPFKLLSAIIIFTTYQTLNAQPQMRDVDLHITAVTTQNLRTDPQTLIISGKAGATVSNLGVEAVEAGFAITFFEDRDLDGLFDPQKDNVLGTVISSAGIAPLQQIEVEASLSGALLFAGNRIFAVADPNNQVQEFNENNNYGHSALSCGLSLLPSPIHPVLQMAWTGSTKAPTFNQVIATPMVVHLDDDNRDGMVGRGDIPEIVFAATDNVGSGAGLSPGILRAINGKTGTVFFEVTDPTLRVQSGGQIAAGDIDGDGLPEILAPAANAKHLLCFEHDGSFKWQSPEIRFDLGGASITNLDHTGLPEIIAGATILNANGQLRAKGNLGTGRNGGTGPLSVVADLDLDGSPEIVAGNTAYRADGTVLWQNRQVGDGFAAVANLDNDSFPEIILISIGYLSALEHDGSLKWGPVFIPGGGEGGAPTVADVDGDGQAEIGIAGALRYTVFETDGAVKWSQSINDVSSGLASSTIFDFENDGRAEVVYGDQNCLFFFDGLSGQVLFQIRNPSGTLLENPVVADVDADGQAELVAVRNQINQFDPYVPQDQGIFVFADSFGAWVATRQVWNQYGYHVTNITHDGRIPLVEAASWLTHNTFRANIPTESRRLIPQPDLIPSRISQEVRQNQLSVRVGNGGTSLVASGVSVAFFAKDSLGATKLIGVAKTGTAIPAGAFEEVAITWLNDSDDSVRIVVSVDDDGTGLGSIDECNELNNRHEAKVPPAPRLTVRFESPADSTRSCEAQVNVVARISFRGTVSVDSCSIGGVFVAPDSTGRIRRLVSLVPGWNRLVAICVANGGTLTASDTLRVFFNQPPVANAGGPYEQFLGTPVQFDATLSRDPENTPLTYVWDFGDGTQGDGPRPTHIYSAVGVFTVVLSVSDSAGCMDADSTTATIRAKPVAIAVKILSPADSTVFFCNDRVHVLASIVAVGGDSLPPIARCEINGNAVARQGNFFETTLAMKEGPFRIIARCQTVAGQTAVDSIMVFNNHESDSPAFEFSFRRRAFAAVTAMDSGSGIASIKAISMWNAKLVTDPFVVGAKRVDFRVEAIDPEEEIGFNVEIADRCGNVTICDPVFMEVAPEGGRLAYAISFPAADRYLTIANNGLSSIIFELNGVSFTTGSAASSPTPNFSLAAHGTITIDLGKHLEPSENILQVTIPNEPGHSARLQLMDIATTVDYVLDLRLVPREFALWQNYPNPFNPETRIVFDLPRLENGRPHLVRLEIFDLMGRKVRTLVDEEMTEGRRMMIWDGRDGKSQPVPSGIYFYRLRVGEKQFGRRMTVVR